MQTTTTMMIFFNKKIVNKIAKEKSKHLWPDKYNITQRHEQIHLSLQENNIEFTWLYSTVPYVWGLQKTVIMPNAYFHGPLVWTDPIPLHKSNLPLIWASTRIELINTLNKIAKFKLHINVIYGSQPKENKTKNCSLLL